MKDFYEKYYIDNNFDKIDNVKRGDIVFVKTYAYSDGYIGKNYLFVILGENKFVPFEYFKMLISSNLNKDNKNNLDRDSIVKTAYIYKLKKENIKFIVGYLD